MALSPTLSIWLRENKHWLLIAAAALISIAIVFVQREIRQPRNLYRILIDCPNGNLVLGLHNVTGAAIGAHFDDQGVVELWIGLNQAALTKLETLTRAATSQTCSALLGEMATVNIELPAALADDVLTLNQVPTEFGKRFVTAFE